MPKRADMTCNTCNYAVEINEYNVECRESSIGRTKSKEYWCSRGLWKQWSERFNSWTFYYLHEGED